MNILLRLYVTGQTPSADRAITHTKALQAALGEGAVKLEIIDVLEDPISALNDDVYATPTLFRLQPDPVKRIFGEFGPPDVLRARLALG